MGGYVTLSLADRFGDHLNGFCLFHSSPYSDNEEKREHRRREIDLIDKGKKELLIDFSIPQTFATDNLQKFNAEVERVKRIALETNDEGIKNALKGMMQRPDRHYVLHDFNRPKLLIAGAKDNYIPLYVSETIAKNVPSLQLEVFENSGHMGFLEEKEKAVEVILDFANKLKW
jgi:pimeloyl-ACP methyl ester carboxylesterase